MPVVTTVTSFFIVFRNVENCWNRFRTVCATIGVVGGFGIEGGTTSVWRTLCPPGVTLGHVLASEARMHTAVLCVRMCALLLCMCMCVCVCSVPVCVCGPMSVYVQFLLCFSLFLVIFLVFHGMTRHFIGFSEVPFS